MADCHFALEGLDWENFLTSSLLEPDPPWHGVLSEPEPMCATGKSSFSSSHTLNILSSTFFQTEAQIPIGSNQELDQDGTPVDSSAVIPTNTSDGSPESSDYNQDTPISGHHFRASEASLVSSPSASLSKKKKRDPRLQCPNFLAGRIPCSCPEEDELNAIFEAEAVVKKRSKVGARCQVPSCGENISHLKGYHQRHRVCLACANSPKVMLKDLPHRYCQQCGKFHRLSDFDEGKRSCRRKLERHNILRRRRPAEEEADAQNCTAQLVGVDTDCSNVPSEGPTDKDAKIVIASRGQYQGKMMAHSDQKTRESVAHHLSVLMHTDDLRTSDDSSGSTRRSEEDIISSNNGKRDEPCLPNALMGNGPENMEGSRNMKYSFKQEPAKCLYKSVGHYVSPCPSGRISFKLYDWNPADFPRRLRQQIFEWLASMPVELESYVRSGCIILTFFVTMTPLMWNKVLSEWKAQVQTFILKSSIDLLGSGQITTQMVKKDLLMKNGRIRSACYKDLMVPFVVDLYPHSLEAGCFTQIYVFGFNFTGGRFLLSFGEQYVECSDWESVDKSHLAPLKAGISLGNIEVHRVTVFLPDSEKFGPAYAEVENVHGLSNFMPLVVADKPICLEINGLNFASTVAFNICINARHKEIRLLKSQHYMDLLIDLGWALKYSNQSLPGINVKSRAALNHRLQTLLLFLVEHNCHVITQRLVQTFVGNLGTQNAHYVGGCDVWKTANKLKYTNLRSILCRSRIHTVISLEDESTLRLLAQLDGNELIHKQRSSNLIKGLQGSKPEADESQRNELGGGCLRTKMDTLPLLEEGISLAKDKSGHKGYWAWSLSWQKKPLENTKVSFLFVGNRKFARTLIAGVGIVTFCTGMCFMLQHPHEVAEISVSLRRCLWGANSQTRV